MRSTYREPDRLSFRCDKNLRVMLDQLTFARRQQMGGLLEDLVEREYLRLIAMGRIPRPTGDSDDSQRLASIARHPASGRSNI